MKQLNSLPLPPGSFGLPLFGETLSFLKNSQQFAEKRHQKYGSVFKTKIFGFDAPIIFVKGAEANRFVLLNEDKYFINNFPPSAKALLSTPSLPLQTGAEHQNRRKILYQAFQPRVLVQYINTIEEITQHYLEKWSSQGTLTWYPEIQNYTFDIACKFLVGFDSAAKTRLPGLFENWSSGLFSVPLPLPFTKFARALRSRQQLLAEIEAIILQRQRQIKSNTYEDVLSILLQAHDEKGSSLNLEELKNQILMLLFAGHGTLTSALASFCLLMAQHPEVLTRCRIEQEKLGQSEKITLEELRQMKYLEQVLQEVLRLIPPVGGGFRKIIHTCEFNGYQFPQGWTLAYQINQTHLDITAYRDPKRFDPQRFSTEEAENIKEPFNYIPFGGGMRECIGKEFARIEMKIFAAHLIRGYVWELLPEQNLEMVNIPVPHPKDGLKVILKNRKV